ncbi:hypothetical protein REPUB_Repub07fG0213300 [Reevesia pubescens]
MIPFVRDFPKPPCPWERFAIQCSQYLVESESSSSSSFYSESESDEDLVTPRFNHAFESVSSKEVERKDLHQGLDTTNPNFDLLKTSSDHEAKELPEKVLSKLMPKGYKPHKRVLPIRDFPIPPPRRFRTPFSQNSEFEDLMESRKSVEEETPKTLEETLEYEAKELSKEAELELSEESIISMYNISLNSWGLSEDEIDMPKVTDSMDLNDQSETSNYKATDLTEEEELSKETELELSGDSIISMYNISLNSWGLSEEEIYMPKVTDSMDLNDQSQTSKYKATDFTEEVASNFMSPILPPNKTDSTPTDVPTGCRRRGPQSREENILEATTFETKGLNHKLSDAQDPLLEVLRDSEESCSKNSCKSNLHESEKGPSTGENQVPKGQCTNQSLEKDPSTGESQVPKGQCSNQSLEKGPSTGENQVPKGQCRNQSLEKDPSTGESQVPKGQCSNQSLEKGPSTGENQVPKGPKQIVIALMAAPKCPLSQKKRAFTSNTTKDTNKRNKRRRKKH